MKDANSRYGQRGGLWLNLFHPCQIVGLTIYSPHHHRSAQPQTLCPLECWNFAQGVFIMQSKKLERFLKIPTISLDRKGISLYKFMYLRINLFNLIHCGNTYSLLDIHPPTNEWVHRTISLVNKLAYISLPSPAPNEMSHRLY